jgi:hypothetical protein
MADGYLTWTQLILYGAGCVGSSFGYGTTVFYDMGVFFREPRQGTMEWSWNAAVLGWWWLAASILLVVLYRKWYRSDDVVGLSATLCTWYCVYVQTILGCIGLAWKYQVVLKHDDLQDDTMIRNYHAVTVLAILAALLATLLVFFRDICVAFLLNSFVERKKLDAGTFVAEVAQLRPMQYGDRMDWHDDETKQWRAGRVVGIHADGTHQVQLERKSSSKRLLKTNYEQERKAKTHSSAISSPARPNSYPREQRPASRLVYPKLVTDTSIKHILRKHQTLTSDELKELALASMCAVSGDRLTLEHFLTSSGSPALCKLAEKALPGDIDLFLSHSW